MADRSISCAVRMFLDNVVQLKSYAVLVEIREISAFALTWSRLIAEVLIKSVFIWAVRTEVQSVMLDFELGSS